MGRAEAGSSLHNRERRNIALLGSTGSIGKQTLGVAALFPDKVSVVGLAANRSHDELQRQMLEFKPKYAALVEDDGPEIDGITRGRDAVIEMATAPDVDLVVVAVAGAGGLLPTLAALDAGKRVALANKETLVMAGSLITDQLKRRGELVPIDSEHSAIWQCLQGEDPDTIEKLVLTASGGAFRD